MTKELFCKNLPFWDTLTEQEQSFFLSSLSHKTYTKGECVLGTKNCCGVIFIQSGCLRVYMLSEDGRDVTLYRLYNGELCMLAASCAVPEITFDVLVDAEQDCDCFVMDGFTFAQLVNSNKDLKLYAYETAVNRFSGVMWVIQQIFFMKADQRLAVFLWDEMTRTNSDIIELTQEQIAKYISSAREVVSRILKYFANEHIVSVVRKGVQILDKKKLKEIATK